MPVKDSTILSNTAVTALHCQRLYCIVKESTILSKTVLYCQRLYYIVKDSIILSKTVLYLQRKHLTYCQRQHYIVKSTLYFEIITSLNVTFISIKIWESRFNKSRHIYSMLPALFQWNTKWHGCLFIITFVLSKNLFICGRSLNSSKYFAVQVSPVWTYILYHCVTQSQ